jgi:Tfp pilus assembly protein PilN
MSRLAGKRAARRPLIWRLAAGVAMAACLVAVVQLTLVQRAERQRIAALRAEQQRIEAELQAVKRIAQEVEPVVVFEDAQGTRVIVDLDSAIQQASLKTWD